MRLLQSRHLLLEHPNLTLQTSILAADGLQATPQPCRLHHLRRPGLHRLHLLGLRRLRLRLRDEHRGHWHRRDGGSSPSRAGQGLKSRHSPFGAAGRDPSGRPRCEHRRPPEHATSNTDRLQPQQWKSKPNNLSKAQGRLRSDTTDRKVSHQQRPPPPLRTSESLGGLRPRPRAKPRAQPAAEAEQDEARPPRPLASEPPRGPARPTTGRWPAPALRPGAGPRAAGPTGRQGRPRKVYGQL